MFRQQRHFQGRNGNAYEWSIVPFEAVTLNGHYLPALNNDTAAYNGAVALLDPSGGVIDDAPGRPYRYASAEDAWSAAAALQQGDGYSTCRGVVSLATAGAAGPVAPGVPRLREDAVQAVRAHIDVTSEAWAASPQSAFEQARGAASRQLAGRVRTLQELLRTVRELDFRIDDWVDTKGSE